MSSFVRPSTYRTARGLRALAALPLVVLLACAPTAQPSPTAAAPAKPPASGSPSAAAPAKPAGSPAAQAAAPKELKRLRLGLPHKGTYESAVPLYVAEEKGFLAAEGITVVTDVTRGGAENVQAVVSGDLDMVESTGPLSIMSAFGKGAPVRITHAANTGMRDIYWYVKADSPIKTMDDLAGKKVGFSSRGSSTHMAVLTITDMLKAKGLAAPEAVPAGGMPDNFTAVRTDQIQAGWASPPTFLDEVDKGTIRIVIRGAELTPLENVTVRVGVANANFLAQNPDVIRGYLRAKKKALDYMYANHQEAAEIWKRRGDMKEPIDLLLKVWDYYPVPALAPAPIKGMDRNQELAVQFGFLEKPLTPEQLSQLVDTKYAE